MIDELLENKDLLKKTIKELTVKELLDSYYDIRRSFGLGRLKISEIVDLENLFIREIERRITSL